MGTTSTRSNQQNMGHLTNDPNYQQVLRDLYANNPQQILQDYPQYIQNQDQHPNRFRNQVDIKKVQPQINDTYIVKNSLQLSQLDVSTYNLEFVFDCISEIDLKIYLIAKEFVSKDYITQKIQSVKINEYKYFPGKHQQFKDFQIDIRNYQLDTLINYNTENRCFPLIIEMSSTEKQLYQYCYFKIQTEGLKLFTQDIKIQKKGKAFSAKDIYGGQKEYDDKECVICLTQKINTLILPCKHMSLCDVCCQGLLERSPKCPICRNKITGFRIIVKQQSMT